MCANASPSTGEGRGGGDWAHAAAREPLLAKRKLDMIAAAGRIEDLRVPPGNRLEALSKDRTGQHSIRINDQWRICFRWVGDDAEDVEIVDYHS
jgi:proteic killer suppression protein